MPKAYVFSGAAAFTEFVNLHRSTRASSLAMTLLTVSGDRIPGGTALVLTGFSPRGLSALMSAFARTDVSIDGAAIRWKQGRHTAEGTITRSCQAFSLTDFLSLQPDPHPPETGHVCFLVRDEGQLATLVRKSLHLGNDRMHFAPLPDGTLVRIERPSYFLLQQFHEDGGAEIYRIARPGIFLRWGWRHPLEALWTSREEPDEWLFLNPEDEPARTPAVPWQDLYDILSPETDLPLAEWKTGTAAAPGKVRVPLRLVPGPQAVEPELWLLNDDGLARLEPLLAVLDQDDIVPYQVSIRREEGGRDLIFVREKVTRGARRHLEFAGRGFAPWLGLNNLLLPAGWTLLPPLRRHIYRDLFRLQPENLTIVLPGADGTLRVLELPERSFTALTSLIDYVVDSHTPVLRELMESSLFDLGPWAAAPSHPGLGRPPGAETAKGPALPAGPVPVPEEKQPLEDEVRTLDPTAWLANSHQLDESALDALHRQELGLERTVIVRQTLSAWQELLRVKLALGKRDDAIVCAVEALWLVEGSAADDLLETLDGLTTDEFPDAADALGSTPQPQRSAAAAFRLSSTAPGPDASPAEAGQWVRGLHVFLTTHHEALRVKERWLTWSWVLRRNADERREVQLRDEIRSAICEHGLSLENTPAFIRTRLFLDRSGSPDNSNTDSGSAADRVASHLHALLEAVEKCRVPTFTELWRALLGRGMARIADLPAAGRLAAGLSRTPDAWTALFVSQTAALLDASLTEKADAHLERLLKGADPTLVTSVQDAREVWSLRAKMDSPAAFLAQENRERTYPKGGAMESGPLMTLKRQLEDAQRAGDEEAAVALMRQMMSLPETKDYSDAVKLPQFIEALTGGLERYKWGLRGAGLLPLFVAFARQVPGHVKKPDPFYTVVLRANLAAGLLAADDPAGAARQIEQAIATLAGGMSELDAIDACAAVTRSIEQLPLERRGPLLTAAAAALFARFPEANSHFYTRPRLYCALVRCAEQIVEAAISRDRLSLELFRNYQLQDEFLILQRIQHESFSRHDHHA